MKYFATISLSLTLLLVSAAAQADDKKSSQAPQSLTVPPGAVEAGPSSWKYTDADGKKWIYRKSPFGIVRVEEGAEVNKPVLAGVEERTKRWKITEEGEKVTFENPSPFGPQRWSKKKSELNEDEKFAYSRAQQDGTIAKPSKAEGKH